MAIEVQRQHHRHDDRRQELAHQQMRPDKDRVFKLLLNPGDRFLLDHRQRAIPLLRRAGCACAISVWVGRGSVVAIGFSFSMRRLTR